MQHSKHHQQRQRPTEHRSVRAIELRRGGENERQRHVLEEIALRAHHTRQQGVAGVGSRGRGGLVAQRGQGRDPLAHDTRLQD